MTEQEANNKLKFNEQGYFSLLFPKSPTEYAAVVKKRSNNFDIIDDYIIEIGLNDFSLEYDFINKRLDDLTGTDDFNKEFRNDIFNEDVVPIASNHFELQSKKLTSGKSTSYNGSANTSGTIGALFKLKKSNKVYLLSNRHVIVDRDESVINNEIVSPARADAEIHVNEPKIIGKILWQSEKTSSTLDAAIAEIYDKTFIDDEISIGIGNYVVNNMINFKGISKPHIGDNIKKFGKTTKLTFGEVRSINCTVNVSNNIESPKIYRHQILTTNISNNGDSGSVIVNQNDHVIGMVVGGNRLTASFCNNIELIFNDTYGPIYDFFKFI